MAAVLSRHPCKAMQMYLSHNIMHCTSMYLDDFGCIFSVTKSIAYAHNYISSMFARFI